MALSDWALRAKLFRPTERRTAQRQCSLSRRIFVPLSRLTLHHMRSFQIHQVPRDDVLESIENLEDGIAGAKLAPEADKTVGRIDVRVKNRGREMYFDWDGREEPGEADLGRVRENELSRCTHLDDAASLVKGDPEEIFLRRRTAVQDFDEGWIQKRDLA